MVQDVAEVLASIGPADANKYENHLNNVSQGASGWVLAAPARAYFIERGSMQVRTCSYPPFARLMTCNPLRAPLSGGKPLCSRPNFHWLHGQTET